MVRKVCTVVMLVLGVSLVTALATFGAAQLALGHIRTSLGADGAVRAILGARLYLTLICLFATGVATILRGSTRALAVLLPLFFLGSQGLGNIPHVRNVAQYLPDQAGMVIMHIAGPPDDPALVRDYGPWTGLGILALWTAGALVAGWLTLRHQDT